MEYPRHARIALPEETRTTGGNPTAVLWVLASSFVLCTALYVYRKMTEFGKATKELAALQTEVAAMAEGLQAVLESAEEAGVRGLLASVQKVAAHTDASGALGAKAAKFKAKAQAPADTRLYNDAMVAKVMAFVEGLEDTRARCLVLQEPLAAWVLRFDAAAAKVAALAAELQRCEAAEAAARSGSAELDEEVERGLLAEVEAPCGAAWAELCAAAREESFKIARRIENREKSRAKKLRTQAELREAAALRKAREEGERRAGIEDAFAQLLGRMDTKETRERRAALDAECDAFTTLLTSFARRTGAGGAADPTALRRRKSSPAAGGGGAASSRGTTPPRALPTEAVSGGRRSPTARQGRGGAAVAAAGPPQKVFQEASICQLPPAVLDMTFDVTPVQGTASVELCSRDGRITVAMYKVLLRLREGHGGYGCDEAFTMPAELLTDRKAKKRYLKGEGAAGRPAVLGGGDTEDGNGVDDDDEDDDAELLQADESGEGEGDGEGEEEEWVNPYAEEEEVNVDVLPPSCAISFFRPLTEGCVVVMMSVGGSFAGGIFVGGDCLVHTTFSRYVTRGKQGGRQSNHEGRTDTVGSQMRRAQEIRFKELVAQQLYAWRLPLHHAAAVLLHAPAPVNRMTFFNPPVLPAIAGNSGGGREHPSQLAKKDPRILSVPFTTHKPSFTEVKRIYESVLSCRYSHQSS